MKLWHIVHDGVETTIDVGKITVLKGNHQEWFRLVRQINDFFNNRKSDVQIYEDAQLINVKDWECHLIPYDAHITLEKINTKSPLKDLLDEVSNKISLSPIYQELLDTWDNLYDEIQLIQDIIQKYNLRIQLKQFEIDDLKSFITFQSHYNIMSPIQFKILLLSLIGDKMVEKRTLVILELPEIFANKDDTKKLYSIVSKLSRQGINFIITTVSKIVGNNNYLVNGEIINEARIETLKNMIINELPFYCDDDLYNLAKYKLLKCVDNIDLLNDLNYLSTIKDDKLVTVLLVIAKKLGIPLNFDISTLPSNIHSFLKAKS